MTQPRAGALARSPASEGEIVAIESLAAGGSGVAHLADGITVFVPRTAPGDRVRLRALRRRRRHALAEIAEILEPGPDRVEPRCAHFAADRCGGCQWQHLAEAAQDAAKRRIVGDALRRLGGLDLPDPELTGSPARFGYRSTITLTARPGAVGFHREGESARVFQLQRCEIALEELNRLWRAVVPALGSLPRGEDVRLKLRVGEDGALHLIVNGGEGAWTTPEPLARAAAEAGLTVTVWWQPQAGAARRMAGPAADPSAVAFEQVNAEVAAMLREAVVEAALETRSEARARHEPVLKDGPSGPAAAESGLQSAGPLRLLDLYAGAGDTALPLAERGLEVTMVEMDPRSVRRAGERARSAGLSLRCVAGRVEDNIAALLPADVVIVNPPRAGLSLEVTGRLAESPPARLVYVSCDPATLARDLKRLALARDEVASVRAFDMFPQTSHVETLLVADPARSRVGAPAGPR